MLLSELAADINATIADHGDLPVVGIGEFGTFPIREIVVSGQLGYVRLDYEAEPIFPETEGG